MSKTKLYWICQFVGWFVYGILNLIFFGLQNPVDARSALTYLTLYPTGIIITHSFRYFIVKYGWLQYPTYAQIFLVIFASLFCGTVFLLAQYLLEMIVKVRFLQFEFIDAITHIVNFSFVFFFWFLIYFSFHFLSNYKQSEIQNLKWQATIKEVELNKLKSQLNPHFMFNSMNSIRALIDENPLKAKDAITQLSNILRSTLMMEKNKVIPFADEMKIVQDYIQLEKTRFEERLSYQFNIAPGTERFMIPPLLLQTLVENAIKHGISTLTAGGEISIETNTGKDELVICIYNSGVFNENKNTETGFGLKNTRERLSYVYGDKASIEIYNEKNNLVLTRLLIPMYQQNT